MATAALHATREEEAILEVVEGMAKARFNKDVAAIAAPYAGDAAVYSLAPPLEHRGIDRTGLQAWLDTWEGPITIEPRDFKVTVAGDMAVCHGFMRMTGTKKGPEGRVDFWMRETLCLNRQEGVWKIVHEHTSVPFYMDGSLRPAFDLQP